MFTAQQRDHVRQRILEVAQADPRVIAGALTGSMAFGGGDRWSDIDVAFGIAEGAKPETVLDNWTDVFAREWGVLHHFDLPSGSWVYRVLLLPNGLQIDVAVTPAEDFGARGPNFRALFGPTRSVSATPQPSASFLIGLSWLYVLHAHASIERHKLWQAEYWISGMRGVDRLPSAVTDPLTETLVRSLDEPELRRALAVATQCLIGELQAWDPALCARLSPLLHEFGAPQAWTCLPSAPNVLTEQEK